MREKIISQFSAGIKIDQKRFQQTASGCYNEITNILNLQMSSQQQLLNDRVHLTTRNPNFTSHFSINRVACKYKRIN